MKLKLIHYFNFFFFFEKVLHAIVFGPLYYDSPEIKKTIARSHLNWKESPYVYSNVGVKTWGLETIFEQTNTKTYHTGQLVLNVQSRVPIE